MLSFATNQIRISNIAPKIRYHINLTARSSQQSHHDTSTIKRIIHTSLGIQRRKTAPPTTTTTAILSRGIVPKKSFSSTPPPPSSSASSTSSSTKMGFWQRWIAPKEMPPRYTLRWYGEMVLVCTVFAITGSGSLVLVRPAVSKGLGLDGSMKDGPWSYRICSLVIMSPIYTVLLVVVGTIFGRHAYFRHFAVKMISRFGIPPEVLDQNFARTSKSFRKW